MLPSPGRSLLGILCALALLASLTAQRAFAELPWRHLPAPVDQVTALVPLDHDGDGDLDLAIGRASLAGELWQNDGHGTFATVAQPGAISRVEATTAFAAGDVNGDGLDDLVLGTLGGRIRLLLSTGTLLLDASPGAMPAVATFAQCLVLADVDGDLDLDLLVGATTGVSGDDRLFLNDGFGRFQDSPFRGFGGTNSVAIVAFDMDGDSDLDLLLVDAGGGSGLLRNDGSGTFVAAPPLPPAIGGRHVCAAAGDLDGDGDLDLAIGRDMQGPPQQMQDLLLLNDGTGVFTDVTAARLPQILNRTSSLHLFDANGDGLLDLLATHAAPTPFGNRLGATLLYNSAAGIFADVSGTLPQNDLGANAATVFDVDGDGDRDLVFADPLGGGPHLYWNDGGTFTMASGGAIPLRRSVTEGVAAGDLDGDGLPELIAAGQNFSILNGRTSLLWNDGTGRFAESGPGPALPNGFYAAVALGDVDGDGDLDVVFGLDQPGQNRLYRNDGARVLTDVTAAAMPAANDFTRVVRLFDADGDGDLDLFAGNHGQDRLARNDGTGTFADVTATALPSSGALTRDAAIGDVDGDGDLDVVLAVRGQNDLLVNQGNGTFVAAPLRMPVDVQDTEAIALADLDGDGAPDLVVGNTGEFLGDPRSWIHRNDGTGSFRTAAISLGNLDVRAIAVGDVEGDGDADFVLGGEGVPVRLFTNAGSGILVSQAAAMPAGARTTARLVLTDLDGDGDLDLFEGDRDVDRVLFSLHRQLQNGRLAALGGELLLTMRVQDAAPGSLPFGLLAAGFPATVPGPTPFGPARLLAAPTTSLLLTTFSANQPTRDFRLAVPANPTLRGLVIGFQALLAHGPQPSQWRLSGLELGRVPR